MVGAGASGNVATPQERLGGQVLRRIEDAHVDPKQVDQAARDALDPANAQRQAEPQRQVVQAAQAQPQPQQAPPAWTAPKNASTGSMPGNVDVAMPTPRTAQDQPAPPEPSPQDSSAATELPERRPVIESGRILNIGLGATVKLNPLPAGSYWRETNENGLDSLLLDNRTKPENENITPRPNGMFVTDDESLAIGQGGNKGVLVKFRGDALSGREHQKPGTGIVGGKEFVVDAVTDDAIDEIIMPKSTRLRGLNKMGLRERFDMQDLGDGRVKYTRKGLIQEPAKKTLRKTRTPLRATPEGGVADTPEAMGRNQPELDESITPDSAESKSDVAQSASGRPSEPVVPSEQEQPKSPETREARADESARPEQLKPESVDQPAADTGQASVTERAKALGRDDPFGDVQALMDKAREGKVSRSGAEIDEVAQAVHDGQYEGVKQIAETQLPVKVVEDDIPADLAYQAYRNTSHTPDKRGNLARREYVQDMVRAWRDVEASIKDEAGRARVAKFFPQFRESYANKLRAYLSAHGRVASAFITGPAKFPVAANEKRMRSADKRLDEAMAFYERGVKRLKKLAKGPVDNSTQAQLTQAKSKLAQREKAQEQMKAANKVLRSKKLKDSEKRAQLLDIGLTDKQIDALNKPDFAGRTGFKTFELSNNNAEIRRLRQRVDALESQSAAAKSTGGSESVAFEDGHIELDHAAGVLRIKHDEKPPQETIRALKGKGFRWSPKNQAWQRKLTPSARYDAEDITGASLSNDSGKLDARNKSQAAFSELGSDPVDMGTAIADAEKITGLRLGLDFVPNEALPVGVPMRFSLDDRVVEFDPAYQLHRDTAAAFVAEELLHAVDVVGADRTISASSPRLDLDKGDIAREAIDHVSNNGELARLLRYPVADRGLLPDDRVKAELFARLGVIYFAEPAAMRAALPKAYEVYHGLFQAESDPVTRDVSRKVWSFARGSVAVRQPGRPGGRPRADHDRGAGNGEDPELGRLRSGFALALRGREEGGQLDLTPPKGASGPGTLQSGFDPVEGVKAVRDLSRSASQYAEDHFTGPGKVTLWQKSVGTMRGLAKKNSHFARVYNLAEDYMTDTSTYAIRSERLAPDLFRRSDTLKKAATTGNARTADLELVANAVFEGTIAQQKVYADEELSKQFGLNAKQIGLYRQVIASAHHSLDDLTKTAMVRMTRKLGMPRELGDMALGEGTETVFEVQENLDRILSEVREELEENLALAKGTDGAEARAAKWQKKIALVDASRKDLVKIANKAQKLKREGYFPLTRFGKYTVDVVDADGKRVYFGMFESKAETNRMTRMMRAEYPGAEIETGVLNDEAFKLYSGLTPETIELFARHLGVDQDAAMQEYLKNAVNNRSALKRLITRKGIPGFSNDLRRVLASFVLSNANAASKNLNMGDMLQAVQDIPKSQGDVQKQAQRLVDYLQNPREEFSGIRSYMFFHFLGGSISSALTNLTQVPMVTVPYLTQFDAAAPAKVAKWMSGRAPTDPAHREAIKRAKEEGVVAPQEIYNLMATARGGRLGGGKLLQSQPAQIALYAWGYFFQTAEQYNRLLTFNAAYDIARRKGAADPYAFAKEAVEETQFVYARHNRPNWARGIGAPLFTFKQFLVNYLEFIGRLPAKQKAIALALLVAGAGLEGLPFAEDLEDIIDAIGQWMGYPTNSKRQLQEWAHQTLGNTFGDILLKGVSGIPGMPIDVQSRLSLGNLIPGTGALVPSNPSKGRDTAELLGPAGSLVQSATRAAEKVARGELQSAGGELAPRAIGHIAQGIDMMRTGEYRDWQDRKVTDATLGESVWKAIGFHPNRVSKIQAAKRMLTEDRNMHRLRKDAIADKWAQGIFERDKTMIREAREELAKWNQANPQLPIVINRQQIKWRLRDKRMTAEDRFLRTMPKELRRQAIRQFDGGR